ncbi:MAG TPA: plastocyanin/azurin family copper-binding protein [Chloroflexota bacterium]|nr:plastocyanin/azurin family copper-binding protein [Chloroflexota bacterium]
MIPGVLSLCALVGILAISIPLASQLVQAQAQPDAQPAPLGSPVINVDAGAFDPASLTEVLEFLPSTVRIPAGGAVHWTIKGFHNVAFASGEPYPPLILPLPGEQDVQVNPLVAFPVQPQPTYDGSGYFNSGLPPEPEQPFAWTLTFSQPGTYEYACIVHPNMKGYVVVEPAGTAVPSQAEVTAQGEREAQAYLAAARAKAAQQEATSEPQPGGGTLWTVPMDIPDNQQVAVHRYFPQHLVVQAGDTVRWVNQALTEPHTVTFRAGAPAEREFVPRPQPEGPPLIVSNPRVFPPVLPPAPERYDGRSYANSGFLGEEFPFGKEFRLTFTEPGQYPYVCVLHEALGMAGFITVTPAGSAVPPANP